MTERWLVGNNRQYYPWVEEFPDEASARADYEQWQRDYDLNLAQPGDELPTLWLAKVVESTQISQY